MAKQNTNTGIPASSVPENTYNRADQIALGLYTQREGRGTIVNPGKASNLNIDKMRAELGDEFQLHKGENYLIDSYNTKMTKKLYDDAKLKAEEQGFWGELAGFASQAIGGEILLGTLEGVGYLLDFDHWIDKLSGGEGDWGNWLSDMAQEGQDWLKDATPIYKDPDTMGRGFWQNAMYTDGWWASNGVSVASALSLLIPVAGWARGVGMAGKGINYLGKLGRTGSFGTAGIKSMNLIDDLVKMVPSASKTTRVVVDGVHKAIISRHLENHMEAASVYQEQFDKYKAQGMTDEEANKAASEGASFTYKAGWAMLLTDIPQYLMLGRAFNASKAILNTKVAKAANQSMFKTVSLNLGEYGKQFATEGFEEAYQFVISEEGKYHADVIAGLANPNETSIADRLEKYSKDAELWTAAFFGGFGGVTFQALGNPTTEFINKKLLHKGEAILSQNDMRLQEIMNRKQIFSANVKSYFEAIEANDERAFEAAKGRIGFDLGVMSAKVGNWSLAKASMEQLKNATPEERQSLGFGETEDFNNNIDKWIKDAEEAVKLYSKNATKYEASTIESITYREYMINQFSKKLPEIRRTVETLKQQLPLINELSVNGKAAFEAKLDVISQERYIKAAKWQLDKMPMPEDEKINLQKNIEAAEIAVEQYKEIVDQHTKEGLTTTEQITLKSLDGAIAEDLSKAKAEVQWIGHYLGQYSEELTKLTSKDQQDKIRTKEDAEAEKAKRNVKASKKAEQIQKEKDILNGVLHPEESELSKTYASSEVATSLEDLDNKLRKEEISWEDLDDKAKKEILKYRETKSKTNENPDISDTEIEQFGLDLTSLEKRDAAGDYKKQHNNATDHIEFETPSNPESEPDWRVGDDIAQGTITTLHTALAWLSPNNSWAKDEFKTDTNKALAAFLEGQNSLSNIEIVFDVNENWLNSPNNRGVRGYKNIRESLAARRMPEDIGFVPIMGTLYRNGKPLEYAGQVLTMSLHDKDFFLEADKDGNYNISKTDHSEAQVAIMETHKREILEAYFNGKQLKAKITGKTGGNINIIENQNGEFARLQVSETLGKIKDVDLVYGNSHKGYISADGKLVESLFQYQTGTNGAIYAITKTANGTPFPLRLQIDNINRSEASIIYKLYADLLTNDKLFSQPISDAIKKAIETSNDSRLKGISTYLNLSDTTYRDLLMHLIYEGKKTESKGDSRLFTYPKNDKTGQPAIIAFGKNQYDLKMLTSPQGREKFIEHIVKHRRRQVDVKLLDNVKYKEYLDSNKIITTNVAATPTKNLFVQPTISYSEDLELVSTFQNKSYVDVAIEGLKEDLEYEKNSEFGNPEIIKSLENQIETLTKKEEPIEQPQAPKGTKDGGVQVEIDFNEDNSFDLSKIIPNPDITRIGDDNKEKLAEYNADEAEDAKQKARKARLERARKKKDEGETGAFKRFKNETTDSESRVNYALKAVNILQSDKAKQVFEKGQKNNWSLDKILQELQIPKEQKQLILDLNITDREQLVLELATNYSYIVKIDTKGEYDDYIMYEDEYGNWEPDAVEPTFDYDDKGNIINVNFPNTTFRPSSYYSDLTVPGGINYTENEISTPLITPSIKGHAQFSTDKGIGWFRSDDKTVGSKLEYKLQGKELEDRIKHIEYSLKNGDGSMADIVELKELKEGVTKGGTPTKTRRILEVQSDLFQKGRGFSNLTGKEIIPTKIETNFADEYILVNDKGIPSSSDSYKTLEEAREKLENFKSKKLDKKNQFIQLLNKDNNWVTFFVKSIIQDSAKKGYEKVLFPKGDTASKIEGHQTLADEIQRIDSNIKTITISFKDFPDSEGNYWGYGVINQPFKTLEEARYYSYNEISKLEKQKEELKSQGIEKLKPIYSFYENRVKNILDKQYGKDNVKTITDEFGNEWYEVEIKDEYLNEFAFRRFRKNYNQKFELEKEIAKIEQILPKEIGINLIPDFIKVLSQGHVAVGLFKNGMITLSEQAPQGTAYHEAGHAVFRTMLSIEEQNQIIEEAKTIFEKPLPDQLNMLRTDHKIDNAEAEKLFYEELLMDELAIFMDNPELANVKTRYPKGIKGFFQKIVDWINYVFRNKLTTRKLFSDINTGKFKTKTPLITRSVAFKTHPIFSSNEVREITQQLAYAAFSKITSLTDVKDNFNVQLILDTLDKAYVDAAELNNEVGESIMDKIDLLYNDRGELDSFWIKNIEEYIKINFDLKKVNKIDDQSDVDDENIDTQETRNFMKSSYEVSGKNNATSTVKFIIAMTPQIESYVNGQPIYKKSSLLGLPMFNDFGTTYNTIEKTLAGTVSIIEGGIQQDPLALMRKKLEEDFKYKPELKFILDKLNTMDEAVQTQFHYTFSRQRGNYIDHLLEGTPGNLESKISSSDLESKERVIRDSWAHQFSQNFGIFESEGEFNYNPEMISLFKASKDNFKGLLNRDIVAKSPIGEDTMAALGQTLEILGVTISDKAFNKVLDSYMGNQTDPILKLQYALRNFDRELTDATSTLLKRTGPLNEKTNHLLDQDTFFKNLLARTEADFRKIGGEASFLGPDGNQYYIYQDNNSISKTISQFKNGDLSHLQKLKESDYGTHSLWLHALLHEKTGDIARETFGTAIYGNLKKTSNADRGDKASDLKPADQYIDVFNKYLHGVFIGLAEADKSQQAYFIGPEVQAAGVSFAPAQGKVFFNNEKPRAARILIGYLADELMRMETARRAYYGYTDTSTGEIHDPIPENEQILYYHYNFDNKGNRIPGNALNSFLFPDINLEALGLKDPETGEIYPLTAESFDNNKELWEYIKTTFLDAVQRDLREAVDFGLIVKEGNGYKNKGIANKHLKDRQGDITAAVADYTLNSIIANVEQTKLFNGDPALYKIKLKFEADGTTLKPWNTQPLFVDFMKRIPASGAAGKDFRVFNEPDGTVAVRSKYISATIENIDKISSSFFGDEYGKFNEKSVELIMKNTGLPKNKVIHLFEPYLKVNQTDAQAWITLEAYRERMRGLGKWTFGPNSHEEAYVKSVSGESLNYNEIKLLAQPLKTVHAELVSTTGNVMSMQYNKQSEAVLLPFLTKNTDLDKLRLAMENQGIDHVIVLDGKKVGARGINKVADSQGKLFESKDIKLNGFALSYNNLFLQQDLPSKGIKPTLVGTQGTKNVLSVVEIEESYLNELTGRQLIDEYHRGKSYLSNEGLKGFKKKIKYNDETGELERDENGVLKYNQLLQNEFIGEISDNHMEALSTDVDLDAFPIKDKIQNKGNAMITKSAVKLKQLGAALIQMSDFGFIGGEVKLDKAVKDGITWFKDPRERLKPMHITEEGVQSAQILIPWTQGEKIQRILKKHNIRWQDLTHEQIKAMIDPEVLKGLSYRIPNQGPQSNDAFEIVGILPPQAGDTMIAYSAITTKTGSDFDIDKAFLILPNFFFNEKTGKIEKVPYDKDNETKEGIENYIIDMMRSMLMHPKAFASVMAPLDDPWLENAAKEMYPEESDNMALNFFTGTTQLKNKMTFDNAKNLVGVIANHMTHHSLALSEGLYFNNYYLGKGIKDNNNNSIISNKLDEDGNRIENTLGAFMNAIVDAAKDPYISRANINQVTANTAFMLARAGVSREWIVAFMGQPILKEYIKQLSLREGRFTESIVEQGVILKPLDLTLKAFNSGLQSGDLYKPEYSLQGSENGEITLSLETLKKGLKGDNIELQEAILAQFLQWQKKAKALNDVIRVCKADVNGATKNLTRAKLASNLLDKVIKENQIGNVDKLLGYDIIDDEIIFNGTRMTGTYYKNSVLASREIFDGIFMSTTAAAETTLDNISKSAGYIYLEPTEDHELLADKINNETYALTASTTDAFNLSPEELHKLLFGTAGKIEFGKVIPRQFSIASRLNQAKSGPLKDNLLIASLETKPSYGTTPAKIYLPNNETTKMVKDDLYLAWEELFASKEQSTVELVEDLMKYAFYASGFSRTLGNFYEHIPMTQLAKYNYSQQIKAKKQEYSDNNALLEKQDFIFKNLYKDNKLVPVVSSNHIYKVRTNDGKKIDTEHMFILVEGDGENYVAGMDEDGLVVFKRFLKMEKPIRNNQGEIIGTSYNLYQLQGYTNNRGAIYVRTNKLGYNNKGNVIKEYIGDGNSSIFAENNVTLPKEIFAYLNGLEPSKLPITIYDKTNKKKRISDNNREQRLDFCINTQ